MESGSRRRSRAHAVVLASCLAAPLALLAVGRCLQPDPRGFGTHEQLGFQPCLPMHLWNLPCPGCGVTTAVSLVAHGRPLAALRTQPFGWVVLAAAFGAACWALVGHVRGRDLDFARARLPWRSLGRGLAILALLAWLYKIAAVRGWG